MLFCVIYLITLLFVSQAQADPDSKKQAGNATSPEVDNPLLEAPPFIQAVYTEAGYNKTSSQTLGDFLNAVKRREFLIEHFPEDILSI